MKHVSLLSAIYRFSKIHFCCCSYYVLLYYYDIYFIVMIKLYRIVQIFLYHDQDELNLTAIAETILNLVYRIFLGRKKETHFDNNVFIQKRITILAPDRGM